MSFTKHKIKIADGDIRALYFSSGQTATPMVFLHGGPGGTYLDEHNKFAAFSAYRDVVLYDQLGSYLSPAKFDMSLTRIPRFVNELKDILDYFEMPSVNILGHSWGGSLAIDFALTHPDRISRLVLSSPLLSTSRWLEDTKILLDQMPEKERVIIQAALGGENVGKEEYEAAEKLFYNRHLCRLDPWPARLIEGFSKGNKELYQAMWGRSEFTCTGTLKNYERFDDLHRLFMPVLLSCGEYDEARPETMRSAALRMKNARVHVFENASHTPYLETPDEYIEVVEGFLSA